MEINEGLVAHEGVLHVWPRLHVCLPASEVSLDAIEASLSAHAQLPEFGG